jgi:outer membrane protein assembly factor BamD
MKRSVTALASIALALALGGGGIFGDKSDAKKDWTAAEYYGAAKQEFEAHNWESAIKIYEALESKFPFGRFAQQAQLEVAYCYYKQGESASAIQSSSPSTLNGYMSERWQKMCTKSLPPGLSQPAMRCIRIA